MPSFFNRFTGDRSRKESFRDWPLPVLAKTISVKAPRSFPALKATAAEQRNPQKYGNAIVIGLGETGEQVLQEWLELVSQDPAGLQENLRALLITHTKTPPLCSETLNVRQFDLLAGGLTQASVVQWRSQRELIYLQFHQAANYRPFEEYLNICLSELKHGVQIIVVGSVAEHEIGLLGPVLQAIRLAGEARIGAPPGGVTALLTTSAPLQAQMEGEVYATLREIGRFTFAGTQWMEPPPGLSNGSVHAALLDYVLFLEARGSSPHALDLSGLPFIDGMRQAMAEVLFSLMHPAGRVLYLDLIKTPAAEIRAQSHNAIVHSLGIATLYIPLQDLELYGAARLARAVIFSENEVRAREGLAYHLSEAFVDSEAAEANARDWLSKGPSAHPFFGWLLNAQDAAYFRIIPNIGPEFKGAFKTQLAHGLVQVLNDPALVDRLGLARLSLGWLEQRFSNLVEWHRQALMKQTGSPERRWLQDFLDEGLKAIEHLLNQVRAWEAVLYPRSSASGGQSLSREIPESFSFTPGSWWGSPQDNPQKEMTEQNQAFMGDTLEEIFEYKRQHAEKRLLQSGAGQVRRSVLDGGEGDLREARIYYENTVRSELASHALETGRAFERVRERLGWWVQLGEQPKVLLVCFPAEYSREDEQAELPEEALWEPGQCAGLAQTILELCRIQTRGLSDDLVGPWLRERFLRSAEFLGRANDPLVRYDQQAAVSGYYRTIRKAYLVGRDKALTGECRPRVFPNISSSNIQEQGGGEPDRLTAITIEYNIPLGTLLLLKKYYSSYSHQESYHIYIQEQIATRYERQIRSFAGWVELPSDLSMLLVDAQRVSLFCQAIFCGLIQVVPDELGYRRNWSVMSHIVEAIQPFPLAPADSPSDLLSAMRAFVLDLPNSPGLESQFGSPFHPSRYAGFIDRLWKEARRCRGRADFTNQRDHFEREYLTYWRQQGEQDSLAWAFANLLQAELEEPVWRDW